VVVTGALLVTAVQIVLAINNRENYALLQIEKVELGDRSRRCKHNRRTYHFTPRFLACVACAKALVLLIALRLVQKLDQLQMLFKTLMYVAAGSARTAHG